MQQRAVQYTRALSPLFPLRKKRAFAFDLDGTVTAVELLPLLARHAGLEGEIAELTRRTLSGEIDFERSFRMRFSMLRHIPLHRIHESMATAPLDPHIAAFITSRPDECVIVTGNLDLWIMPLLERLGCRYFASHGTLREDGPYLRSVLDKGAAARALRTEYRDVIAIGESMNDVPLFKSATVGVAFAGIHAPVPEIRRLARYHAPDGAALCGLLTRL